MRTPKAAVHHIVSKDGTDLYLEIAVGRGEFNRREAYVVSFKNRTALMKLQEERAKYAERLEAEVSRRTRDLEGANRQLRELQTRLMEAQRLATAGEMAGEIAHAIFNPLTVLIGTVQMRIEASRQVDPDDETILRLAQRVATIVERMLLMSRRGRMQPEDVPPACLVADLREEMAERCRSNGVEIIEWLEPDLPDARVDRALLTMALVQIADNAVDAMASGGKLSLSVERVPGADALRFRIQDTGSGIPPDLTTRVLEPFFSTKAHGTGLGLTIARGVIQGHEGNIRFKSQKQVGTEVIVEIPRCGLRESLGATQPRQ
jgi:signal transduction histidine kinase